MQQWQTDSKTMVLLGVENEQELLKWTDKISGPHHIFREPDINNQATAIAIIPTDNKMFRDLRLL